MRPTRKSRSVNKWHDYCSDIYSVKGVDNSKRDNHRKRKLPDTPQWSEEELSRFYIAYRQYGKDWEKVAAVVRNRSVGMVESLYTMNRAYLSLPEGTASVVGFIAMMLDHYSNLAGSDSEEESSDVAATSQNPQKRARGKAEPSNFGASNRKFNAHSITAASKHTGGSRPHAARKRTPRFPVSYSCENIEGEKFLSSTKANNKKEADINDDAAALEIGLAVTEASAKGGSSLAFQAPNRRNTDVMLFPAQNAEIKSTELKITDAKSVKSDRNHEEFEGSMKADTGQLSRLRTYLKQNGRVGTLVQKGRSNDEKKLDADNSRYNELDDRTEVGQRLGAVCEKLNRDARISSSSLQCSRNKDKKVLFSKDEASAIEALQTLADLSLKMPSGGHEKESMVQIKEEMDDHLHESSSLEAMPGKSQRDEHKPSGFRVKDLSKPRSQVASNKTPKLGKVSAIDNNAVPKMEKEAYEPKTMRKKPNALTSKARDVEKINKSKRSSQNASLVLVKDAEHSTRAQPRREGSDPAQSTVQVCETNQISLPTRVRGRCKMHLKKPQNQIDSKFPDKVLNEQSNTLTALVHGTAFTKKLINCLSNPQLRRWCTYEWFYGAIDYPWFAKREFIEYLYHVGLGHVPKLTRVEWGVIRSSLGKPRRFSQQFLKEEKKKLNQYRDSVRKHCTDLRKGIQEGWPKDLARPLSVGQRVIAIHPKTRETSEGNVLTVDHSRCRVQFDRHELGVEYVMDIDCMSLNHLQNIPTPLTRHMTYDQFYENNELRAIEQAQECIKAFPGDEILNINCLPHLPSSTYLELTRVASEDANVQTRMDPIETSSNQEVVYSQPCTIAEIQANKADVHALDKKGNNGGPLNSLDYSAGQSHLSGSHVNEIIESSRAKARTMVHVSMQTVSSLKVSEYTFEKIEEAIDILNKRLPLDAPFIPLAADPMLTSASDRNDVQIPSELITQCVATLLMIQKCTEGQFLPADIAQILHSALISLKPCCSENLPAYAEIQKCMGMIRNQILSLLPV